MADAGNYTFSNSINGLNSSYFSFSHLLGRGGNAEVYLEKINGKNYAIKVFHNQLGVNETKLLSMIRNPPRPIYRDYENNNYPIFSWPLSLIRSYKINAGPWDRGIGYIMPYIDTKKANTLDYFYDYNLSQKLRSSVSKALSFKIEILRNLCLLVSEMHESDYLLVDLKPQNICVFERTNVVALIDCDGFTVKDRISNQIFSANMISPDYIAPEIYNVDLSRTNISVEQDLYALAVIIFQCLNNGIHPFQGILMNPSIDAQTNDQKAFYSLYPHSLIPNRNIQPIKSSIHNTFLDTTRKLFDRSFQVGKTRPTPQEWAHHFDDILTNKKIIRCGIYPNDTEHMRFIDKECPACLKISIKKNNINNTMNDNYKMSKTRVNNQTSPMPPNVIKANFVNPTMPLKVTQLPLSILSKLSSIVVLLIQIFFACVFGLFIIGFAYEFINNSETKMADLNFCNDTNQTIYMALTSFSDDHFSTHGWYKIPVEQCKNVGRYTIDKKIYWYAISPSSASDSHEWVRSLEWQGAQDGCVWLEGIGKEIPFKVEADSECKKLKGYAPKHFHEITFTKTEPYTHHLSLK